MLQQINTNEWGFVGYCGISMYFSLYTAAILSIIYLTILVHHNLPLPQQFVVSITHWTRYMVWYSKRLKMISGQVWGMTSKIVQSDWLEGSSPRANITNDTVPIYSIILGGCTLKSALAKEV
jgi:hypothetical protein